MNEKSSVPKGIHRTIPEIRVLMLDFPPAQIAALWHAAAAMLPAIEVRMYCRTCNDLDGASTLADRYDVVLVDAADHSRWFARLEKVTVKSLLKAAVVIAGIESLGATQATLLRAGYPDVVCVQDAHAKTIINATIKAFLGQLKVQRIDLPPAVAMPIQKAMM